MASLALVSVVGPDRVGLVSAVTSHLFEAGINLRDVTFAAMGRGAEFTALCEVPDGLSCEDLQEHLARIREVEGARVAVTRFEFDPTPGPETEVTHQIEIGGGDQPGLIARLSDILTQFGANIVRLDAQTLPGVNGAFYLIRFAVAIPPERAETCLAVVTNTAESLGLSCSYAPFQHDAAVAEDQGGLAPASSS